MVHLEQVLQIVEDYQHWQVHQEEHLQVLADWQQVAEFHHTLQEMLLQHTEETMQLQEEQE